MDFEKYSPFKIPQAIIVTYGAIDGKYSGRGFLIYRIFTHIFITELFTWLQIAYLFTFKTFADLAKLMSVMPTFFLFLIKSWNFFWKSALVRKLMVTTKELFSQCPSSPKLQSRLVFAQKFSNFFLCCVWIACCLAVVTAMYEIPYKMWYPFDTTYNTSGYWTCVVYQMVNVWITAYVIISMDLFQSFFLCYIAVFLEALCDMLELFDERKTPDSKNDEFLEILKFQIKVSEYIDMCHQAFASIWFIQGFTSTLILCTTAYSMTVVSFKKSLKFWNYFYSISEFFSKITEIAVFLKVLAYLGPMIFEIWLPSFFGSEIEAVSEKLSTSLFHSPWVNQNKKFKLDMLIIMEKIKRPIKMSIFATFDLNLATFTQICRTAYSLFAVCKNMGA